MVRTRRMELELYSATQTQIRPNFILPLTAPIHLNTLGPTKNANP